MNRLVAFGLILICCHAQAIETDRRYLPEDFADYAGPTKVEKFLENLKTLLRTGNESLGLPVLDPYINEHLELHFDENLIKLDGLLENIDVRGISEYNVNSGNLNIFLLQLSMSLSWPLIYATTKYEMNGNIGKEIPVYGKGDMKISVQGFDFSAEINFRLNGNYLKVKSVGTKFALNALQFKATGLYNDEETSDLISAIISDMVPQMITEYQKDIQSYLHPLITSKIDAFLADKTLADLIKMFG